MLMKKFKSFILGLVNVYCREFKLVTHDIGIMLFLLFLPLAYPIIYSLIYNPELVKDVPLVVVDNDRTPLSRELVRNIDACDEARVLGYAADLPEAKKAMDSHKAFAILEITDGFAKKIGRSEQGNGVLYSDMTLLLRFRGFLMATTNVMMEMGSELMTKDINLVAPLAETIAVEDPLPMNYIPMGNIRSGFDSFIMPGVLILILHQCIVLAVGMAGGARRESRYLVGYNPHNNMKSVAGTMLGQILCYITILVIPMIFLIHYVPLMFRFPMAGSLAEEMVYLLPMVLGAFGIGYVFQAFVTERESVFVSWVVTSVMFLLLSGLIWPHYDMIGIWRYLADALPSTWGVTGFIKIASNGATISQISGEFESLWIVSLVWLLLGYLTQRFVVYPSIYGRKSEVRNRATVAEI